MARRTYDLTVYFCQGGCLYSICSKRFYSFERAIRYCKDFDIDTNDMLFYVWDSEMGEYNITDYVEA